MIKVILLLFALFVSSAISIVAGYYNTLFGIDITAVEWVFNEIPVISTSLLLVVICPLNFLITFFRSKGNYEKYSKEIISYSVVVPFMVILIMLPSATATPDNLGFNYATMLFIAISAQVLIAKAITKTIWIIGRGNNEI